MLTYGADISTWQGDPNWEALRAWLAGKPIEFFMLRTEGGLQHDGRFASYCNGLNGIGFYDLGTYAFFRASKPIKEQVDWAVLCHGDLPEPLAIDIETLDGAQPEIVADALQHALESVTAAMGRLPTIYTDPGDWSHLGAYGKSHHFERYPLWVATIGSKPMIPPPWSSANMWQYTWERSVPGFHAPVDGDVFYGSIQDWRDVGRPAQTATDPAMALDKDPDSTPTGH